MILQHSCGQQVQKEAGKQAESPSEAFVLRCGFFVLRSSRAKKRGGRESPLKQKGVKVKKEVFLSLEKSFFYLPKKASLPTHCMRYHT
jgi:hypothetical protein